MFEINGRHIRLSRGDTGILTIRCTGVDLTANDRAVLTIRRHSGGLLIEKVGVPVENKVQFPFMNEETQAWKAAEYEWDVRFILDAQIDVDGRVTDGREVITPMLPGQLTVEKVVGRI